MESGIGSAVFKARTQLVSCMVTDVEGMTVMTPFSQKKKLFKAEKGDSGNMHIQLTSMPCCCRDI